MLYLVLCFICKHSVCFIILATASPQHWMSATHLSSFVILFLLRLVAESFVWSSDLLFAVGKSLLSPLVLV